MKEPIRILCVDDEVNVLNALKRLFMDDDYEILTSSSAADGLKKLEAFAPVQIVISDYRMPEMNGVDLLREVCRRWPETVRIVLSGYADTAAVVAAINEGQIYRFIAKPWNDDELRISIASAVEHYFLNLRNRELSRELQAKNEELNQVNEKLERLVTEVSSQIVLQKQVIDSEQHILNALPVAVFGLDEKDEVVMCNQKMSRMLCPDGLPLLGVPRGQLLPPELNDYLDRMDRSAACSGWEQVPGTDLRARWRSICNDEHRGFVVVCDHLDAAEDGV